MKQLTTGLILLAFADLFGAPNSADAEQLPRKLAWRMLESLGTPFLIFRDQVQEELNLSGEQKQKLSQPLLTSYREAMEVLDKLEGLKPEEQQKELQKSREKLAKLLKETLTADQQQRMQQLELQREGAFRIINQPQLAEQLKITEEQRQGFAKVVQELQRMIAPLAKEGGIEKIDKLTREYSAKLESLLTDAQKKQWQEMLGKPFDFGD